MKITIDKEFLLQIANSQTELKYQVDKLKEEIKKLAATNSVNLIYKIEAIIDNPAEIQLFANEMSPIFIKYKVSKMSAIKI